MAKFFDQISDRHRPSSGDCDGLDTWAAKKGEDGIRDYWRTKNLTSLDGLPTGSPVDED